MRLEEEEEEEDFYSKSKTHVRHRSPSGRLETSSTIMEDALSSSTDSRVLPGEETKTNGPYQQVSGLEIEQGEEVAQEEDPGLFRHAPVISSEQKLGVLTTAVLAFYNVSGGPFGVEASVRAAGNFYTLAGFLIMPFVWSLQEAMVTAELGPAFPESAGGVAWVEEAFGQTAGWMSGWLGWVSGATDNAIYPVLFLDYLLQIVRLEEMDMHPVARFGFLSVTSVTLAYINWLGLPVVGRISITICFIAMSPFIIMTAVGVFQVHPHRWFQGPSEDVATLEEAVDDDIGGGIWKADRGGILWRPFLNSLFWNLNSFDSVACFAADVEDPGRVLPTALAWSVVAVAVGYFVPLLIALGATDYAQHEWVDGFFATVAGDVVGPWLGAWTVFAAGISNIALFQAELSADAFQLMGMADRGHLPAFLSQRSRYATPTYGILIGTAVIVVMGVSDLGKLIEMLNFNYAIALLMEFAAFIKLRITRPELPRPWRVPLSTRSCILALIPTFAMILTVMVLATYSTLLFCLGTTVVGMALFAISQRTNQQGRPSIRQYHAHPSALASTSAETEKEEEEEELVMT